MNAVIINEDTKQHVILTGGSGTGKSGYAKSLILENIRNKKINLVVDTDNEYGPLTYEQYGTNIYHTELFEHKFTKPLTRVSLLEFHKLENNSIEEIERQEQILNDNLLHVVKFSNIDYLFIDEGQYLLHQYPIFFTELIKQATRRKIVIVLITYDFKRIENNLKSVISDCSRVIQF